MELFNTDIMKQKDFQHHGALDSTIKQICYITDNFNIKVLWEVTQCNVTNLHVYVPTLWRNLASPSSGYRGS
jgi:hypothetical protein